MMVFAITNAVWISNKLNFGIPGSYSDVYTNDGKSCSKKEMNHDICYVGESLISAKEVDDIYDIPGNRNAVLSKMSFQS